MFKIFPEIQKMPNWFQNFSFQKLYAHPIKQIRWIIYILQFSTFISLVGFSTLSILASAPASLSLLLLPLTVLTLNQIIILGIHARSRLAWLLIAGYSLHYLFTPYLPIAVALLILLEHDETQRVFHE